MIRIKTKKKSRARLEREIDQELRRHLPSRHHVARMPDDEWLVARDAILESDPDRAATIANDILSLPGSHAKPSRAFKKALHDAPSSVRKRFEGLVEEWESRPGKPEFEGQVAGKMTLYVPGHGHFSAPVSVYRRYTRKSRKELLNRILEIYEGIGFGNKGDKAAHWRGFDKDYLAMIVADASGESA